MHETDATTVIEWAPFRVTDGVSEAAVVAAADAMQEEFLTRQPGYVRRELLRTPDGQWADLVVWRDRASVEAAMAAVGNSPACRRYFSLMAPDAGSELLLLNRARRY